MKPDPAPTLEQLLADYRRATRLVYQVERCGCVSCFDNQVEVKAKEETAAQAILDYVKAIEQYKPSARYEITEEADDDMPF